MKRNDIVIIIVLCALIILIWVMALRPVLSAGKSYVPVRDCTCQALTRQARALEQIERKLGR